MSKRDNVSQTQRTRDKIKSSYLVKALMDHALNNSEMSSTQIAAAKILLSKTLPDVRQQEIQQNVDASINITWGNE
tara:strand:+ start:251 stop:478 length:228 start_codon:yes stop_codon:yes gene_type:complete